MDTKQFSKRKLSVDCISVHISITDGSHKKKKEKKKKKKKKKKEKFCELAVLIQVTVDVFSNKKCSQKAEIFHVLDMINCNYGCENIEDKWHFLSKNISI